MSIGNIATGKSIGVGREGERERKKNMYAAYQESLTLGQQLSGEFLRPGAFRGRAVLSVFAWFLTLASFVLQQQTIKM